MDVTGGIAAALTAVLGDPAVERARISHAMLGTTHATNAILQRRGLARVAVLRIGSPATHAVRPLFGWPEDLRAAVSVGEAIVPGGIEFDGRDLVPFDGEATSRFLGSLPARPDGVAIVSVFAPVSARHEEAAAAVVARVLGEDMPASLSHEVGSIGLLERENATVLNVALAPLAREVAAALGAALADPRPGRGRVLRAERRDADADSRRPCGCRCSRSGAGRRTACAARRALTGLRDAIVIDVGGTSTDIGALTGGFPRESMAGIDIGGVRTNFPMPDIVSLALGGGTVIEGVGSRLRVGPESVGAEVTSCALVFGGTTLTLTDAAVAGGRMALGSPEAAAPHAEVLRAALAVADSRIEDGVDRMKTARGDRPVIAVGGGADLVPGDLPGASSVVRPSHAGVANAIGAAIAPVSGTVDRVETCPPGERPGIVARLCEEAIARAEAAGAAQGRAEVVEVEEIPLAYLTTPVSRFRVKAAGPMV